MSNQQVVSVKTMLVGYLASGFVSVVADGYVILSNVVLSNEARLVLGAVWQYLGYCSCVLTNAPVIVEKFLPPILVYTQPTYKFLTNRAIEKAIGLD